jgi:Zn-finger nucleic acid-binding protein
MMASARNYARNREGGDAQYTLMPSTFLGPSQRWIEYAKEKEARASSVAERPRRTACPVCGKELGMGIIKACPKCGFWLDDGDDPRKIESYRQDFERGGVVPFDAKKLIADLAQRATAKQVRKIAAESVVHVR